MGDNNRHTPDRKRKEAKVVLDGNAFYELDMECVRKKEEKKKRNLQKRQRN